MQQFLVPRQTRGIQFCAGESRRDQLEQSQAVIGFKGCHGILARRKRPNFACVVHAHFNYGNIVFRLEFEQLQRQADVVVEVAGALHHPQAVHQ